MTKTATWIKDLEDFNGHASLYKVEPPITRYTYDDREVSCDYVIVSAVCHWAYETYIFPASADGIILDWAELDGSLKDTTDHAAALAEAGYTIGVIA